MTHYSNVGTFSDKEILNTYPIPNQKTQEEINYPGLFYERKKTGEKNKGETRRHISGKTMDESQQSIHPLSIDNSLKQSIKFRTFYNNFFLCPKKTNYSFQIKLLFLLLYKIRFRSLPVNKERKNSRREPYNFGEQRQSQETEFSYFHPNKELVDERNSTRLFFEILTNFESKQAEIQIPDFITEIKGKRN